LVRLRHAYEARFCFTQRREGAKAVGRLPSAFENSRLWFVDALLM
jgi:hypothetical protein